MRQISLALIFGAFLLTGCDAGQSKAKQAQSGNNTYKSAQVTTTDSQGNTVINDQRVNEGEPVAADSNFMQAEEAKDEKRTTFNEKQFSDDASDYPVDKDAKGETFNEDQITK